MSDATVSTQQTPQPGKTSAAQAASRAAFEAWVLDYFEDGRDAEGKSYFLDWSEGKKWNDILPGGGYGHPEIDAAWESWQASDARAAAAAQAFLLICQEELVRTRITSLPQKLVLAKERGMTLDELHDWMRTTAHAFKDAVTAAGADARQRDAEAQRAQAFGMLNSPSEHPEVLVEWHAIVNGTPSSGTVGEQPLPPVTVVLLDRKQQQPNQRYFLRVEKDGAVESYDLLGSVTRVDARRIAKDMGFEPTHWAGLAGWGIYAFEE